MILLTRTSKTLKTSPLFSRGEFTFFLGSRGYTQNLYIHQENPKKTRGHPSRSSPTRCSSEGQGHLSAPLNSCSQRNGEETRPPRPRAAETTTAAPPVPPRRPPPASPGAADLRRSRLTPRPLGRLPRAATPALRAAERARQRAHSLLTYANTRCNDSGMDVSEELHMIKRSSANEA